VKAGTLAGIGVSFFEGAARTPMLIGVYTHAIRSCTRREIRFLRVLGRLRTMRFTLFLMPLSMPVQQARTNSVLMNTI
jgi:hypothetical protein